MGEFFDRLRFLFRRERFDRELEEELRYHLERKAADGFSADQARRQFGNATLISEESREVWTWNWVEQTLQDVRYAIRTMRANPGFVAVAVISLALGIGANTAIYSFLDAIFMRSLPVDQPEQLVILNWRAKKDAPVVQSHWGSSYDDPRGGMTSPNFPYPAFKLLGENNNALSSLFGYVEAGHLNFVVDQQAVIVNSECVTGNFFGGLGVPAVLGRLIGPEDDRAGAPPVVMLAYDYWQSRFGGDATIAGKQATINGTPVTIVGVAAPEFYGVAPEMKADLFIPMAHQGALRQQPDAQKMFDDGHYYWIEMMGRLKPGVTLAAAEAQLSGPFHNFVLSTATKDRERADLPSLWIQPGGSGVDSVRRRFSKPLWILMGMVGLILVVACSNVAGLLSARATSRRREIAVRLGLGAGRLRVIRQLLTESLVLALSGGIAGVGVAAIGVRVLLPMMAGGDDLALKVALDWRVLGFTLLVTLAAGIAFGMAPALHTTQLDLTPALREARSSEPRSGKVRVGRFRPGFGHMLVTAQIAIALLLAVAAGLFVRTLANLHSVNLGFDADRLMVFSVDASRAGYKGAALKNFYGQLQVRLESLPGVTAATSTDMPMVSGWNETRGITVPGIPPTPEGERGPWTAVTKVGPNFFETMRLPIIAGRATGKRDVGASPVGVVNEVFAAKYFPGQNPLGRHFAFGGGSEKVDVEIVGVARTARYSSLSREIPPVVYTPWAQDNQMQSLFFELRTAGDPLALSNAVRRVVREASPLVPVERIGTQMGRIEQTIGQERTFAKLSSCFGGLALVMACVGLYGTVAFNVGRRTNEIGVRMALGATRVSILSLILKEVGLLCAAGVLIGLFGVYQGTPVVKSLLFGMQPRDPLALLVPTLILIGCALIAGYLPARRASRINPMVALRHE